MKYDVTLTIEAEDMIELMDRLGDLPTTMSPTALETRPWFQEIVVSVAGLIKMRVERERALHPAGQGGQINQIANPVPDVFAPRPPWQGRPGTAMPTSW